MRDKNITFSRIMLMHARHTAKQARVKLPTHITSIRADHRRFRVEAMDFESRYVTADNAYHARARLILRLVDEAYDRLCSAAFEEGFIPCTRMACSTALAPIHVSLER